MITVAITNFNREQLLYESIEQIIDDERISEIVISDDCSDYGLYTRVCDHYKPYSKVKIYRNEKNLDCYLNKHKAVSLATNEWVILFDSDNILTVDYIDKIFAIENWSKVHAYFPSFAKPHFDFRKWEGHYYKKGSIANAIGQPGFATMLNAMNYFINRDQFLKVFDSSVDPVTSDSIYMNYKWLEAGNKIHIVKGLEYEHRIHEGSHYKNNVRRTKPGFHESIVNKLKAMR